ncbi:hypothetical protein PYCC9005_002717 [Savitreella phatthalungensis]
MPSLLDSDIGSARPAARDSASSKPLESRFKILSLDETLSDIQAGQAPPALAKVVGLNEPLNASSGVHQTASTSASAAAAATTTATTTSDGTGTRDEPVTPKRIVPTAWLRPRFVVKTFARADSGLRVKIFCNVCMLAASVPLRMFETAQDLERGLEPKVMPGGSAPMRATDRAGGEAFVFTLLLPDGAARSRETADEELIRTVLRHLLRQEEVLQGLGLAAAQLADEEFAYPVIKGLIKGVLAEIIHWPAMDQRNESSLVEARPDRSTTLDDTAGMSTWKQAANGPRYITRLLAHPIAAHPLPTPYTHEVVLDLPRGATAQSWSVFYDPADNTLKVLVPPMEEFCEVPVAAKEQHGRNSADFRTFARDKTLHILYRGAS